MSLIQIFIEALESLNVNKLRSGLTILGIVIGVGAVIALLGVGQGTQNSITGTISGLGTNLVFVFSGNQQVKIHNIRPLTIQDANAIGDPFQSPHVLAVAPMIRTDSVKVAGGGFQTTTVLGGITPEYFRVRNFKVAEGDEISQEQYLESASVALLGVEVADKLFKRHEGLIGETIRIEDQLFRVIGVMEKKGGSSFGSQDNIVLVPYTTARTRLVKRTDYKVDLIMAQATRTEDVAQAMDEITNIIRSRHRTQIGADDFMVFSQENFVQTASSVTGILTIFLGGIAGISLLVGGIGIMNIMLVAVTERTREIGLRKALGARKRDILIQFLTESSFLSLIGGVVGILLGWIITLIVAWVAEMNNVEFHPIIGLNDILLATLFSTGVGLFFGFYPANRAANLQPVEALRFE